MTVLGLNITELKKYILTTFEKTNAINSQVEFVTFLKKIIFDIKGDLEVEMEMIEKDLSDPVIGKAREFGALDSLKRVLLPIAENINYKATNHPDWGILAGRLEVIRLKLNVPESFVEMLNVDPTVWRAEEDPLRNYYKFATEFSNQLEEMIVNERDYTFYFFGIRTLEKSYLMKVINNGNESFIETPQRLYLRIATFLWMDGTSNSLKNIKEYYDLMSLGYFTHASPTMFHAGVAKGSLASCFLLTMQDDLENIFDKLKDCAMISKSAGGIGLDISSIRHSKVGHLGQSSGIVPMLKVFDAAMCYVDQAGRRNGSATIFLQPWHIDFPDFIELKRQHGKEERRARDLFYAVWNCDIFMDRVKKDAQWTLFCPKFAPRLKDTFGEEFEKWYLYYETELAKNVGCENYMKKTSARTLWNSLLTTQMETGMPFMANKDTVNYTSNQKNLGLINSSNLCMEITEVTDAKTISSCNLASIALDEFVENSTFNHAKLGNIVRKIIRGLNHVIDKTWYPLQKYNDNGELIGPGPIKSTNLKYRPLGLGVQGLAETFLKMDMAWTDANARELNKEIFATIYYHAIDESAEIAKEYGNYVGFDGSPASKGQLKFDMLAVERARKKLRSQDIKSNHPDFEKLIEPLVRADLEEHLSKNYDWEALRLKASKGLYNSLLVALMPTASSAQIRYKTEAFEPMSSNLYVRSVLSGNHIIINRWMVNDLKKLGLWNKSIINFIIKNEGSIAELPENLVTGDRVSELKRIKEKCQTFFELSQKLIVEMSIDRAFYVCQSQSLNIYSKTPTAKQLNSLHFYAWENGLSTGMYYLRSAAATEAIKFTVSGDMDLKSAAVVCTEDVCVSCSS
jgi:ribonucleoside-diphosphate reductase alpha chain